MRRRNLFGRSVSVAYPGTLGVKTDKGLQTNYPLVLDAPTVDAGTMLLRYDSGALSTDAEDPFNYLGGVTYNGIRVVYEGKLVFYGGA